MQLDDSPGMESQAGLGYADAVSSALLPGSGDSGLACRSLFARANGEVQ